MPGPGAAYDQVRIGYPAGMARAADASYWRRIHAGGNSWEALSDIGSREVILGVDFPPARRAEADLICRRK
jgi:hypothetical protein